MEVEEVHRRRKSRLSYQSLHSSLGMRPESEERPQKLVCYGAGDETGILDVAERSVSEDLQLAPCFPALCEYICDIFFYVEIDSNSRQS